ncbi:MAG: AMP-binding protein [Chitinophagaceae bacterium]|nr:AMP-binding protein [Chitinophagaceae bacterium]
MAKCSSWTVVWLFEPMYEYNLALRFQDIVERYPQRISLWFNERESYTYLDLNCRANQMARLLFRHGLASGDVVCISGLKNIHTFSLMLACLKIGVVYSIFDPDSPPERLRKIFSTCRPRLVAADAELLQKMGTIFAELLIDDLAGCTLWFSVPSLLIYLQTMKATDGRYLRRIKRFIFGGEGYPKPKLKALYDVYSETSEFFNVSGPTECTCICSSYKITADDFRDLQGFPPLGSIAGNFSYLILDDENKIVSEGELGELCLLGPNVGLGYYNDPERTSASFVQNPYNDAFREVIYKTGDLVRLDPADSKLYIHGRKDNQIKHMGYRIELEEIENALHSIEYILEAIAIHSNSGGLSRIIAVLAVRHRVNDDQLRQDLRKMIPDYMFHQRFIMKIPC